MTNTETCIHEIKDWYKELIKDSEFKDNEYIQIDTIFNVCMDLELLRGDICSAFIKKIGHNRCHDLFDGKDFYW